MNTLNRKERRHLSCGAEKEQGAIERRGVEHDLCIAITVGSHRWGNLLEPMKQVDRARHWLPKFRAGDTIHSSSHTVATALPLEQVTMYLVA